MLEQMENAVLIEIAHSYVVNSLMHTKILWYSQKVLPDFIGFLINAKILTDTLLKDTQILSTFPKYVKDWYLYFVLHVNTISNYYSEQIESMLIGLDYKRTRSRQILQWLMLPIFKCSYKNPNLLMIITSKVVVCQNSQLLRWILDFFATPINATPDTIDAISTQRNFLTGGFLWQMAFNVINSRSQRDHSLEMMQEFFQNGYFIDISQYDYALLNHCLLMERTKLLKVLLNGNYLRTLELVLPEDIVANILTKYVIHLDALVTSYKNVSQSSNSVHPLEPNQSISIGLNLPFSNELPILLLNSDIIIDLADLIISKSISPFLNTGSLLTFFEPLGLFFRLKGLTVQYSADKPILNQINPFMKTVQEIHKEVMKILMALLLTKEEPVLEEIFRRRNLDLFRLIVNGPVLKKIRARNENIFSLIYHIRKQIPMERMHQGKKNPEPIDPRNPLSYLNVLLKPQPFKSLSYLFEMNDYVVLVDAIKENDLNFLSLFFSTDNLKISVVRKAWHNQFVLNELSKAHPRIIEFISLKRSEAVQLGLEKESFPPVPTRIAFKPLSNKK